MSVVGPKGGAGKLSGMSMADKRATWNGSYLSLAEAGSPPSAMSPSFPPLPPIPHSATIGSPTISSTQSSPRQGSRSSRVLAGTPRKLKRRSDLAGVFQTPVSMRGSLHMINASMSAPTTPAAMIPHLEDLVTPSSSSSRREPDNLSEEDSGGLKYLESDDDSDEKDPDLPGPGSFGVDALALRRRRRKGLSVISSAQPNDPTHSPLSPPSSSRLQTYTQANLSPRRLRHSYSASKFTTLQSPASHRGGAGPEQSAHNGHPLSMVSIQSALHRSLASKRYAASHLLALRFDVEDRSAGDCSDGENTTSAHNRLSGWDEGYWENVRSVMGLMSGALGDAAVRVCAAVDKAREELRRGVEVDEEITGDRSVDVEEDVVEPFRVPLADTLRGMDMDESASAGFAPGPGHLARFAVHVEAIEGALSGAREELVRCVDSLRQGADGLGGEENVSIRAVSPAPSSSSSSSQPLMSTPSSPLPPLSPHLPSHDQPTQRHPHRTSVPTPPITSTHPALQAYEHLRRELGLALRECERGRERLLDLLSPPRSSPHSDAEEDDLPALGADLGSDESDAKRDSSPRSLRDFPAGLDQVLIRRFSSHDPTLALGREVDDVTAHLLMEASAANLPIAGGVEQVYETDLEKEGGGWERERSKLSREERIRMVREQRASMVGEHRGGLVREQRGSLLGQHEQRGSEGGGKGERWGPGGDVVKELKDVIWEVGKRRRRVVEEAQEHQRPEHSPSMEVQRSISPSPSPKTQRHRSPSPQASPSSQDQRFASPSLRTRLPPSPPPQIQLPPAPTDEYDEEDERDESPGDLHEMLRSSVQRLKKEMRLSVAELQYTAPDRQEESDGVRTGDNGSPLNWIPPPGL